MAMMTMSKTSAAFLLSATCLIGAGAAGLARHPAFLASRFEKSGGMCPKSIDPINGHKLICDPATGDITFEPWCGTHLAKRDSTTNVIILEVWMQDDKLDRAGGPAYIVRDALTGMITNEEWRKAGNLDRADGPAIIERDALTGFVTHAAWWKDGMRFRPSAEARAEWLQKSGETLAPPAAAKPAMAPGAPG